MYQCTASNEKDTIYSTGRLKVKIMKGKSMQHVIDEGYGGGEGEHMKMKKTPSTLQGD